MTHQPSFPRPGSQLGLTSPPGDLLLTTLKDVSTPPRNREDIMKEVLSFITDSFQVLSLHPLVGFAIVGIAYTWVLTYQALREAKVLGRPQKIALLSVLAATMQAPLPFVMAFRITVPDRHDARRGWIAGLEVLFFLVALSCALTRRGPARWLIALSSIVFLVFTGFMYLVTGIQF
jgi:hypothetical protein